MMAYITAYVFKKRAPLGTLTHAMFADMEQRASAAVLNHWGW